MEVININDLKFGYNDKLVIKDISLKVEKGDFLAISGENGSGKSTLIKLLIGELKKQKGSIKILGKDIEAYKSIEEVGYVPQLSESRDISFPLTCFEYVILNLYREFNAIRRPTKECRDKTHRIFKMLNISQLEDKPFNKLSGGQQQRVMIARCLVGGPDILILDEPTVGIDQASKLEFLDLLKHLNKNHGITILIISHEMELIGDYTNKIVYLREGRLVNA